MLRQLGSVIVIAEVEMMLIRSGTKVCKYSYISGWIIVVREAALQLKDYWSGREYSTLIL